MVENNQQYAYFSVHGDFDPAEITKRVGVEPSEYWKRGDISPQYRERKSSRWILHSRVPKNEALEAHIDDVLA